MEARISYLALLARMEDIRVAVPESKLEWRTNSGLRGLRALPLAFRPIQG
jgi:cytochrome P450